MITLKTYSQSLDAQLMEARMHIVIIDSQYVVLMYDHLRAKASMPPNGCLIIRYVISARNDVHLSCSSISSRQSTALRFLHYCFIYIVRITHLFASGLFFSIFMTYHMQIFMISTMCTRSEQIVMHFDQCTNAVWQLLFMLVHIAYWLINLQLVSHYWLKFGL